MVPTRRFWLLAALGIPIAGLAVQADAPLIVVLYDLVLIAAAYVTTLLAPSAKYLRLTRKFDPVLSVRVPNKIQVRILNDGPDIVRTLLRDEPPPSFEMTGNEHRIDLDPGREQEFTYNITPFERGGEYFRGTFLRIECPLGLVWKEAKLPTEQPVRVYPNVLALREFDLLKQKGRLKELGIRRSRQRGLGTEFESLRDYAEGDDFRKIDWKASARRGKFIVRQFEQERNQSVLITIDVGRHMLAEVDGVRKLDRALDACLMLTHAAVLAGDLVGLLVYADTVIRYIPPKKGRSQMGIIIEAIHDLIAMPLESDPMGAMAYLASRYKRRSLLVAFTDLDSPDMARQMVAFFGPLARRHLALLARVSDPRLNELYNAPLTDASGMYQRAAADMMMTDRKKATTILNAAGIHNLEAEPDDLSAALVSFYFQVKERSLI